MWDVLKAADKYQVQPVVTHCFRFLLRAHPCRHKGPHLVAVLEVARRLQHMEEYWLCLEMVRRHAGKILGVWGRKWSGSSRGLSQDGRKPPGGGGSVSSTGLTQLSYPCLLDLVRSDHLEGVDEVIVHEAVVTWTKFRWWCQREQEEEGVTTPSIMSRSEPTREELREIAGELVRHVRYLTVPRPELTRLLGERQTTAYPAPSTSSCCPASFPPSPSSGCLLTKEEVDDLLHHGGAQFFPASVNEPRRRKYSPKSVAAVARRRRIVRWCIVVVLVLLVTFVAQYLLVAFLVSPLVKESEEAGAEAAGIECKNETLCGASKPAKGED